MPQDGTPIACPLAFGDGPYTVRIMRNTSGNNYVELCSADIDVALTSEFAPFLRPNVYCSYTASSSCVAKAREILGTEPEKVSARLSANILKNAMGVGIPGTGMIGLPIAIALGALVGRSEYQLEC